MEGRIGGWEGGGDVIASLPRGICLKIGRGILLVNLLLVIGLGKLNPYLNLNLNTRTRYPMAETWDLRMNSRHLPPRAATRHLKRDYLGQHVVLSLPSPTLGLRASGQLSLFCSLTCTPYSVNLALISSLTRRNALRICSSVPWA